MSKGKPNVKMAKNSTDWLKILKICLQFGIPIAAMAALLGNVTTICDRDALRSRCLSLGFQIESTEKLITALNSTEPVTQAAAFAKLTELLTKQPEVSTVAKPLFIAYFNQRYAIGSLKQAATDSTIHDALNLISILSKNLNDKEKFEINNVDLQNVDFSNLNFDGIIITKTFLQDSNMKNFSLKGATITESRLDRITAPKLNLRNTNISKTCFESAELRDANLKNSSIADTDFNNANLAKADLSFSNLNRVRFAGSNISGVVFTKAEAIAISTLQKSQTREQIAIQFPNVSIQDISFDPRKYSQCELIETR
ncbi:pentapeptide repeat-containing protein [Rhodoferax bucti]|uniref:pentapeptide repeat-containing protein n=1 Tax=Rhodoferax bucti TaxID=2576305 RepID=UPI0011086F94|nr:pentapeptide repeat-containing protein [Rhodoferax bucti]